MVKRFFAMLGEYAESVAALLLAVLFGLLGIVGVVGTQTVSAGILATLAVVAFAMLRDRANKVALDRSLREATVQNREVLQVLPERLERIDLLAASIAELRSAVDGSSTVRTLRGHEVGLAHESARRDTDRWFFKGGTGTYTRAVTLPLCVEAVRHTKRPLQVRLEIIDPTNAALCERYANLRHSILREADGTGEQWTARRAKLESCATIVAGYWYREQNSVVDIQVALAATMSLFRYDMATEALIITQDDPNFPALLIPRDKPLFNAYALDLKWSFDQARQVRFKEAEREVVLGAQPTVDGVRRLLDRLGLAPEPPLDEEELATILEKALHAKNPYT